MKKILIFTIAVLPLFFYNCGSNSDQKESSTQEVIKSDTNEIGSEPDHTVLIVKKQNFAFGIRTGGRIMVDSKDVEIVTAKSSGIVIFSDHFLFPGVKVSKTQKLFALSGQMLADDNTDLRLMQMKADLEKASANFDRAKSLIADRVITQEHFLETKNEYEKILNEYNILNSTYGSSGNIVSSPVDGHIREIFVTEGQMITTGQPLASIIIEHNLVLKADLSPEHMDLIPTLEKANFKVGYSEKVFKTSEMNGMRISYGKSTGVNSFFIPVYFRIDNDPELIDGTFAEVYLIGKETNDVLVVPNSALMEEYAKLYVFVEDEDGDFLKRYITAGNNDGESTEVVEGLAENETIVATGTYNIKLAQMGNSAPAHTHNH